MSGLSELAREEGGSVLIADMRDSLPVADNWIDEDAIKQNVRFHERMHPEQFRLDQIQNGRLSAIFYFHMPDIW